MGSQIDDKSIFHKLHAKKIQYDIRLEVIIRAVEAILNLILILSSKRKKPQAKGVISPIGRNRSARKKIPIMPPQALPEHEE